MRLAARVVVGIATVSIAAARPGAAQETPRGVATAFFEAIAEARWRDAARAMDLMAFDRYRRERIAALRLPQPPMRQMTVDEYLQHDPGMPRAVAEYHVRKMREDRHDPSVWLLHDFAEVPSVDSLAALSVEEAAARWLQAQDYRWRIRQSAAEERKRGCPVPADAYDSLPAPSHRVLAAVAADSTTAYVLHEDDEFHRRRADRDADIVDPGPNVLILRRRRDRWRILPRLGILYGPNAIAVASADCSPTDRLRAPR